MAFNVTWFMASATRLASDRAIQARRAGDAFLEEQLAEVLWGADKVLRALGFTIEARWALDRYGIMVAVEEMEEESQEDSTT